MIDWIKTLRHIHDAVCHISDIFPSDTNLTCTFTAHANANTWSAWAEIADSGANALSSLFTDNPGHITALLIETISDDNALYMIEISWGASHNIVGRFRFAGVTKFQAPNTTARFWPPTIPAGQTVYYRMKTETAVADTCTAHLRYHTH